MLLYNSGYYFTQKLNKIADLSFSMYECFNLDLLEVDILQFKFFMLSLITINVLLKTIYNYSTLKRQQFWSRSNNSL